MFLSHLTSLQMHWIVVMSQDYLKLTETTKKRYINDTIITTWTTLRLVEITVTYGAGYDEIETTDTGHSVRAQGAFLTFNWT